jgi:translation initiation factor 5
MDFDDDNFFLATKESSLNDNLYRYQLDSLKISVGGKKGNLTTYFENSEYFAKKLEVPSVCFMKFIANKISCPSSMDKEKKCVSFKGEHKLETIRQYLMEFVIIYILCNKCDLPQITLNLNEHKNIIKNCRACGETQLIEPKYMDKTYDFIKKNL